MLPMKFQKLCVMLLLVFIANSADSAKPEPDADMKVREQMVQISRELGVTCTYCHNSENFKDPKNKNFGIARDHIRITQLLNSEQGFKGKPKVTCYVCHQGEAKFDYESVDAGIGSAKKK